MEDSMSKEQIKRPRAVSRRTFLAGAAAATAGAATLGFPTIVKAQGPISMRWQSTWPSKDIFHEYALDYAKKVNDMTGGDLRRSEEHTSELQSRLHLVCRLLLEKKKKKHTRESSTSV